ncbi:LacI family DNA-binding transcriptional regulator [Bacillus subtilis]|uniref:LacI family DNA-binding transcriptional regulator n=1 Tax=Lederbergia ruris TaxID=217495 RepID=UPI00202A1E3F
MIAIKKVTIKDVARQANVSISTVSNALNDINVLHPDTKAHILKVAKDLNYIPNLHGKNLKAKNTKTLGLFLRSIKGPYYGTLVDSIANECEKYGYDLSVFITKNESATINNIMGRKVDGAILLNEWLTEDNLDLLENSMIPLVFLDREKIGKCISSVVFSSYKGGEMVARHLLQLGHKKIGYIHGVEDQYDDKERFRGFQNTLEKAGLSVDENNCLYGLFEEETTFNEVKQFIRSGKELPDAFFAANDLSAIGCIKALQSEGYAVPQDITVIGFDDIELSAYFNNGITTVRNPIVKQGVKAVERLLNMITNKDTGKLDKLDGELIIRNSCSSNRRLTSHS